MADAANPNTVSKLISHSSLQLFATPHVSECDQKEDDGCTNVNKVIHPESFHRTSLVDVALNARRSAFLRAARVRHTM